MTERRQPCVELHGDGRDRPAGGMAALAGEIGAARALVEHAPTDLPDVLARILARLAAEPQLDRTDPATIAVLDEAQLLLDRLTAARDELSGRLSALDHGRRASRAYRRPELR